MKQKTILTVCFICLIFVTNSVWALQETSASRSAQTPVSKESKTKDVVSEAGLNIKEWGVAIDAIYNPDLDDIIPGYHIVNVVLSNRRNGPISLNVESDKWMFVDAQGKRHVAYNHVNQFDKKLWPQLPAKLQALLDYPPAVNAGKSAKIDVFVPKNIDLSNFKEIIWKSSALQKTFSIFTAVESNVNVSVEKEFDIPSSSTTVDLDSESVTDPANQEPKPFNKFDQPPQSVPSPQTQTRERNLGGIIQQVQQSSPPSFDPSLDDTIIIR